MGPLLLLLTDFRWHYIPFLLAYGCYIRDRVELLLVHHGGGSSFAPFYTALRKLLEVSMTLRHIRMCRCNNRMERGAAKSVWDCSFAPPFVEANVVHRQRPLHGFGNTAPCCCGKFYHHCWTQRNWEQTVTVHRTSTRKTRLAMATIIASSD
jgi:hypothetical protein